MVTERPVVDGVSPYGSIGDESGPNVLGLLDNLLAPKTSMPFQPGETPRWDESDKEAFNYLMGLDSDMVCLDTSWDTDWPGTGYLDRPWQQLTASLPFSEAERYWMIKSPRSHWLRREREEEMASFPDSIIPVETTVVSAGVRQVARGRDLVRRWASWRRETQEFAGQGSLTRSIFLLDHMAYELVPGMFTRSDFREQYPHVAEFDARAR